jgi:LEA14-like dessication related protein
MMRWISRQALLLLSTTGLLVLARCLPSVRPPGFELLGVRADSSSELVVTLAVSNPNSFSIKAQDLDYRILIDTNVCGSGSIAEPLEVRARDTAQVEFPLQVDIVSIIRSLPSVFSDTVKVRIEGSYSVSTLFGLRRFKLDREKRLVLKDELKNVLGKLFQ